MANKGKKKKDGEDVICKNRRAFHNFAIGDRLEAGIQLRGTEVKSCREGKAHLNDAYVDVKNGEAYLINAHIAEYSHGNQLNHEPLRTRKLLLHGREIEKIARSTQEKGQTAVPIALYFKRGKVKVDIGLATGKSHVDRRQDIKERDTKREIQRVMRRRR